MVYWLKLAPPPLVGGSQPDGWMASWVKGRIYASVPAVEEQDFTRLTAENGGGWYGITREPIQSFEYYQSLNPTRPTAERKVLVLQPIGPFSPEQKAMMEDLRDYCQRFFQLPARIAPGIQLPVHPKGIRQKKNKAPEWCAGKGQYDAAQLLDHVLKPKLPGDAVAYLGVTMADLYAGDMAFVFGLGSFRDRVGVYSLTRYFPQFAGHSSSRAGDLMALRRACQVLNHETGHMLGLFHCVLYKCSMNGSNSLVDADAAPLEYCPVCHRKLIWNVGAKPEKRFKELTQFYAAHGLKGEATWLRLREKHWKEARGVDG